MNILIITPFYLPWNTGGISKVVDTVASGLTEKKVNVKILIPNKTHKLRETNYKNRQIYTLYLPNFQFYDLKSVFTYFILFIPKLIQLLFFLLKNKIDISLIIYPTTSSIYFYFLKKLFNKKYILSFHGSDNHRFHENTKIQKIMLKRIIKNSHKVLAVSEALMSQVRKNVDFPLNKAIVIHSGIDPSLNENNGSFDFNYKYILSLAWLSHVKGPDILIKAFAQVPPEKLKNVKLIMAGDGPMESKLKSLVKKENIEDRIIFSGKIPIENISTIISRSLFCVVPSRNEGFPIAILEYGLLKKAVIASSVGGIPEIILNENTGLLFDSENVYQLAQKIEFLLDSEKFRDTLGENLSQLVINKFSKDVMIEKYYNLFQNC